MPHRTGVETREEEKQNRTSTTSTKRACTDTVFVGEESNALTLPGICVQILSCYSTKHPRFSAVSRPTNPSIEILS